jgi:hypothetical protein
MRHHPAAIVGDPARAFFQERISGPIVVSLVGRLFAAGSVWLGRDSENRLFVAIDPLLSEPVAAEVRDQSLAPDRDTDAGTGVPAALQVAGGLLKSRPITPGDYSLVSPHSRELVGITQAMFDQLIAVLEEFKVEEGGHFDPDLDEPIEFMSLWRGDEPSRTLLGYWAGLSPRPEEASQIHIRGGGTWTPRKAADMPPAESVVKVHPSHWHALTRAVDDKDVIPDAALMLLPVAPSGGGFTVRDLPAETAEHLAQAHLAHGGNPDDPLGVFINGRAEWSSDLLLAILLDLANDRPVGLSSPAAPGTPAVETAPSHRDTPPSGERTPRDDAVEIPVAPADSAWTTLADYAIELAGTPHLLEPEACGDSDCAIFHAALVLMNQSKAAEEDMDIGSDSYWTQFAIRELTGDAIRSLAHLRRPFSGGSLEAPPGPFVEWYRAWVPPIREAHDATLAAFRPMLSGLYMLAYPDQAAMDLSVEALRKSGFEIPPWRDPMDDW